MAINPNQQFFEQLEKIHDLYAQFSATVIPHMPSITNDAEMDLSDSATQKIRNLQGWLAELSKLIANDKVLDQMKKLEDAINLMSQNSTKFERLEHAQRYQERMKELSVPTGERRWLQMKEQYGEEGAKEVRSAENRKKLDELKKTELDKKFDHFLEMFGGDRQAADKAMRETVAKGFPEFLKNSSLSAKQLAGLVSFVKKIPGLGGLFNQAGIAASQGNGMGWVGAVVAGLQLGMKGIEMIVAHDKEKSRIGTAAHAAGMTGGQYRSADAVLSAMGGSGDDLASVMKGRNQAIGNLFMGRGGTEFLEGLAAYGIDITGSGKGGLLTDQEKTNRVAQKIHELVASGDVETALSLKSEAGFSDAMYEMAVRQGGAILKDSLFAYEQYGDWAQKGEDESMSRAITGNVGNLAWEAFKNMAKSGVLDIGSDAKFAESYNKILKNRRPAEEASTPVADPHVKMNEQANGVEPREPSPVMNPTRTTAAEEAEQAAESLEEADRRAAENPSANATAGVGQDGARDGGKVAFYIQELKVEAANAKDLEASLIEEAEKRGANSILLEQESYRLA